MNFYRETPLIETLCQFYREARVMMMMMLAIMVKVQANSRRAYFVEGDLVTD
jgi:hypothetical protein